MLVNVDDRDVTQYIEEICHAITVGINSARVKAGVGAALASPGNLDIQPPRSYPICTSRPVLPADLYETLIAVWRSRLGRRVSSPPPHQPGPGLSEQEMHEVSRRVRELSRGLTRDRVLAGERYLSDPALLGAYLLHFWPISYAQAQLCIAMMGRTRLAGRAGAGRGPGSALDLGAGPGPVSIALLDSGVRHVMASDRSAAALALARKIASARGHALATHQWDARKPTGQPRGPFDLIAIGHTLNELWTGRADRIAMRVGLIRRLSEELAPGGRVLILEPALRSTAQEAIRVRDSLAAEGFLVELPCVWQGACPALPEGTCHGEFAWSPPPGMIRLAHAARIGRETLKMAWFVLARRNEVLQGKRDPEDGAPSPDGGLYRVVSEPLLSKSGRIRYLVCGPLGRFPLSAPRDTRVAALKPFFRLSRGDGVRFSGAKRRESGWGLDEESRIEIVERVPSLGSGQAASGQR